MDRIAMIVNYNKKEEYVGIVSCKNKRKSKRKARKVVSLGVHRFKLFIAACLRMNMHAYL